MPDVIASRHHQQQQQQQQAATNTNAQQQQKPLVKTEIQATNGDDCQYF